MNILFFHSNGINPEKGGISRITYNLTCNFREHGHNVFLLGYKNTDHSSRYDSEQTFIPSECISSFQSSVDFLYKYICDKSIDIIINQNPFSKYNVDLIYSASKGLSCKVISCYHNTILTPIYNYAYQKEWMLKRIKMGFLLSLLNNRIINKQLVR